MPILINNLSSLNNYNYASFMTKLYVYYFSLTTILLICSLLEVDDIYIFPIAIFYTLWIFNIINTSKLLLLGIVLYYLYENGSLEKLKNILKSKFVKCVEEIHKSSGNILAEFRSDNLNLNA